MSDWLQILGVFILVGFSALWATKKADSVKNCLLKAAYIMVAFSTVTLMYPDSAYLYALLGIIVVFTYSWKIIKLRKSVPQSK